MSSPPQTAIVTGASQGIGAGIVKGLVGRGFNVVANSRKVTQSTEIAASDRVALVDGHIGEPATAAKIVETARSRFQSLDVLVNNAGSFFPKPFTDYTAGDFKSLVAANLEGFLYLTQFSIKQRLAQKTGGSLGYHGLKWFWDMSLPPDWQENQLTLRRNEIMPLLNCSYSNFALLNDYDCA